MKRAIAKFGFMLITTLAMAVSAAAGKHIGIIRRRPGALTLSIQKLHHLRRNHIPQRFQHIQGANNNVEILQFTVFVERDQVYAL